MTSDPQLPDYERPPVVEIIAAVQFVPVPVFGATQIVEVGKALPEWTVRDVPPAIPPMSEGPPGLPAPMEQTFLGLGSPPVRAILTSDGGRWTAQLQQDRVAVHERKVDARPSFGNVAPKLSEFSTRISDVLGAEVFGPRHSADLVEVIYENRIGPGGGWANFSDVHRVLRVVNEQAGDPPFGTVEQATIGFTYALTEDGVMDGRLRVMAEPVHDEQGRPVLTLRLVSRRFVRDGQVDVVLEACHTDIVRAFTAITTDEMHKHWGRFR